MSGAFAAALATALGRAVEAEPEVVVRGGCINECFRWQTASGPVFLKRCCRDRRWLLEAEQDGLNRLRVADAIRVPEVLGAGVAGDEAFLALEWLDLRPADDASDARLGAVLARLHGIHGPYFGLECDNAIGATRQPNGRSENWPGFWRERRLGFQFELAVRNGYAGRLQDRGRRLLEKVDAYFTEYRPLPSLLHGDLWSGNRAMLANGTPVVFDPAIYYGDPEADIAMTRLFGGFGPAFYAAYAAVRQPDAGAATRRDLYNLYHVLNHLNLFGDSYRAQAEAMIDRLLAAAGH